jgi:hypothetical protein
MSYGLIFVARLVEGAILDPTGIDTDDIRIVHIVWLDDVLSLASIVLVVFKPICRIFVIGIVLVVF